MSFVIVCPTKKGRSHIESINDTIAICMQDILVNTSVSPPGFTYNLRDFTYHLRRVNRGLVVEMPCFQSVSSLVRVSMGSSEVGWPGRYINVQHRGGLSLVFLQLKKLGLYVKRREPFPCSGFLSYCDMT